MNSLGPSNDREFGDPEVTVFLISEWFYPDMTGAVRRLFRNALLLKRRGIRFVVLTEKLPHHEDDKLHVEGIQVIRIAAARGADTKAILVGEARDLWRTMGKPKACIQIISASSWHCAKELAGAYREGLPSICGLTIMPEVSGGSVKQWRERIGASIRSLPFKSILALSGEMKRTYRDRYFWISRKLRVIANGVDTDRFRPIGEEEKAGLRSRFGLSPDAPLILYVGSLVPRKRLHLIVDAWEAILKENPDAKLLVVGVQKQRVTQSKEQNVNFGTEFQILVETMEKYVRNGSIRLFDEVENPEIFYQMVDLFVLPSQLEGVPNTLIEAFSCGLPALISDFEGKPRDGEEIGVEGRHYVTCVRENDEWGDAICGALKNKNRLLTIGRCARRFAKEVHSLEDVITQLTSLYRQVALERPGTQVPESNPRGSM